MSCPVCRKPMILLEFRGVETDVCPLCEGIWLDRGELEVLAPSAPTAPDPSRFGARGKRRCPRCGRRMRTGPRPGSGVEVDQCPAGHGLWLDRGELGALIASRTAGPEGAALAEHYRALFEHAQQRHGKQGQEARI